MSLYAIADTHLSLLVPKPMDIPRNSQLFGKIL